MWNERFLALMSRKGSSKALEVGLKSPQGSTLSDQRQELQSDCRKKSFRYLQGALSPSEWQQRSGEKQARKASKVGLVYFTRLSGVEKKKFFRAIGLFQRQ